MILREGRDPLPREPVHSRAGWQEATVPKAVEATVGADEEVAGPALIERPDHVVRQTVALGVDREAAVPVAVEAAIAANPESALPIAVDRRDVFVRQTIATRECGEGDMGQLGHTPDRGPDPHAPLAILADHVDPVIAESLRRGQLLPASAGIAIDATRVRAHPQGAVPVLEQRGDVGVRRVADGHAARPLPALQTAQTLARAHPQRPFVVHEDDVGRVFGQAIGRPDGGDVLACQAGESAQRRRPQRALSVESESIDRIVGQAVVRRVDADVPSLDPHQARIGPHPQDPIRHLGERVAPGLGHPHAVREVLEGLVTEACQPGLGTDPQRVVTRLEERSHLVVRQALGVALL